MFALAYIIFKGLFCFSYTSVIQFYLQLQKWRRKYLMRLSSTALSPLNMQFLQSSFWPPANEQKSKKILSKETFRDDAALKTHRCIAASSSGALSPVDCFKSSCRTKYPGFAREVHLCSVSSPLFVTNHFGDQIFATSVQTLPPPLVTEGVLLSYCLTVLLS